ncbi:AraC family transcriptional regulator [Paenibacillus sp. P26]|nr:AraC family transcriptional regulator [Paenibacillus sp. P26]
MTAEGSDRFRSLERIGLTPGNPHREDALTPELLQLMWDFFELVSGPAWRNTDLARLIQFHQIFGRLAEGIPGSRVQEGRSVSWLQRGLEYMEIHYTEGISVGDVSRHIGVDRTHFTKQFRKTYGLTPIEHLQQMKMNRAKQLLEQTGYTLTEIAHSVGYPDLFSFSKAFKKIVGISPNGYRQKGES